VIIPGVTSVTTRKLSIEETIDATCAGGLKGIEWEAIKHVRPGDFRAAELARNLCALHDLEIPSYGSYYRTGVSEDEGMPFSSVLETCKSLGAPMIRIWAGDTDYDPSDEAHIQAVVVDTLRIADLAGSSGIGLSFEFHGNTLTNTADFALRFAEQVQHPAVAFSWQPPHGVTPEAGNHSLEKMLPLLSTLHVFHWDMGPYAAKGYTPEQFQKEGLHWNRKPLEEGSNRWLNYLQTAARSGRDHWALLEFARDNSIEQHIKDARILGSWVENLNTEENQNHA
jgi:3-dehydroshikimate dehydratase